MYIINWFKKPYFFINSVKYNIVLSLGVGYFIFLFLFLFQPYTISSSLNNKLLYTAGFGLITFLLKAFFFTVPPYFFKDFFKDENWTVGKQIMLLIALVSSITFSNYFYNLFIQNTDNMDLVSLKSFFLYTFSVSIFPIIIFIFISEKLHRFSRIKNSKKIMGLKVTIPVSVETNNKEIKILANNNKENVTFNTDNLIYISSNSNYASFFINSKNGVQEHILRNTLSNINKKLEGNKYIIRCHKSFIVNTKHMNAISGNARGYFLESELLTKQIPISRSFKKEELKNLIH
ncbi:LytR/AlgR family response regulator transcription factor [Polaribacter sp. 11A2H]|uniref:LytR/AlgR family response regulator transcription factor n=1 Tax=Polaribacter sp. 11A2H TaxID=2687290 RepID=UPI001409F038|nr:LytTR family DNA-binding domain-containing protein [Polaribacter sp. 11A2H]